MTDTPTPHDDDAGLMDDLNALVDKYFAQEALPHEYASAVIHAARAKISEQNAEIERLRGAIEKMANTTNSEELLTELYTARQALKEN